MGHFNEMNYGFEHEPSLSHLIVLTTKLFQSDFCVFVSQKEVLKYAVEYTYTHTHAVVFCSIVRYNRKYSSNLNNAFIQILMNMIFFVQLYKKWQTSELLIYLKKPQQNRENQTGSMVQSHFVQPVSTISS